MASIIWGLSSDHLHQIERRSYTHDVGVDYSVKPGREGQKAILHTVRALDDDALSDLNPGNGSILHAKKAVYHSIALPGNTPPARSAGARTRRLSLQVCAFRPGERRHRHGREQEVSDEALHPPTWPILASPSMLLEITELAARHGMWSLSKYNRVFAVYVGCPVSRLSLFPRPKPRSE